MEKNSLLYQTYLQILRRELVPAMGCTEPIAVAYAAAVGRRELGCMPTDVCIEASGNIIKNVKSVIVPHTGGLRGLEAAAAVGILYGRADCALEVIAAVGAEEEAALPNEMKDFSFTVKPLESEHVLDIRLTLHGGGHTATVRLQDEHTCITGICVDGVARVIEGKKTVRADECVPDYATLTVADIFAFAGAVDIEDVRPTLARQIAYNTAISDEGMKHGYGARIGQVISHRNEEIRTRAIARAAAGSDARMGGCDMPVIICSGSGNQGMTASLPVIAYAEHYQKSEEELLRALVLSNLITLHLKSGIGRLSAYCGAVSAGAGAGAGIAYLLTGELTVVNHTVVNALAISSGIICDGAKASCAAKIAMAVEAGIMGYEMFREGCEFFGGEGLVSRGVENTIRNIYALGHDGMKETDKKIIEIMTGYSC